MCGGCTWRVLCQGPRTAGCPTGVPQHLPGESGEPRFQWLRSLASACRAVTLLLDAVTWWGDASSLSCPNNSPRSQILLWEASCACFSIWARGVKNAAAIKNPINFQPLVRAAGLSWVGGVLSVVNLSPVYTALICRSDRRSPGR